jgi:hypothetical protein
MINISEPIQHDQTHCRFLNSFNRWSLLYITGEPFLVGIDGFERMIDRESLWFFCHLTTAVANMVQIGY